MRKIFFLLLFAASYANAQQNDGSYTLPPKAIADMLLAKAPPAVSVDDKGKWMVLSESNSYPSVEELAQPELKIAGMRINPANYAPSRQNFINNIYLKDLAAGKEYKISGLPSPLFAGSVSWSPDYKQFAFTQTLKDHVDLYVVDIATQKARKLNKTPLNLIGGAAYQWVDGQTLIYRSTLKPASAAPPKPLMPKGPTMQENYGKAIPRPTFQDLIKSPYDEELFAFFGTSQLIRNKGGVETKIGEPGIYNSVSVSPDKK